MKTKAEEIDMSPMALARRLEEVRALHRLMVYLRSARPVEVGIEEPSQVSRSGQRGLTDNDPRR